MSTPTTFQEQFEQLCGLLGCNETTIVELIGKPDETITNEYGTKFLFYDRSKALFTISSDSHIAKYLSSPHVNADGKKLTTNDEYYSYKGIKLGDHRSVIQNIWGKPTKEGTYWYFYAENNISGTTKMGEQYDISLSFDNDKGEILTSFEGHLKEEVNEDERPVSPKSKSGCFIATACYGDYCSPEVIALTRYRDNVLLKTTMGKIFVRVYYNISPPCAMLIAKSEFMKKNIRQYILKPILSKIENY